ncbi:MAG: Dam family site-specific DNA-(adenine-N6)-methyltransferase [Chloroflexi bacterium]|nr:Dam family site-specific DNA-(adenine-N6)-methyltransferase [Chloroflexota bacterium]MDA1003471.1 Dam family site-specific DNA-(adenine-N6)-methyltransferase [Chloroflexota bacterium]
MKWAGGKAQLLHALRERAPREIDTYYEPFIGGGALFFALASDPDLAPRRAVLNDANRELVTTYQVVRDHVGALVERLRAFEARYLPASEDGRAAFYYAVREEAPTDPVEIAARLIFLNKTCFNGLYRVNRRGQFNVPHGRYVRPRILDCDALLAASGALATADIRCGDFEAACAGARKGDFVYFDPPFHPLSKTSSFTGYTEGEFGRPEQLRLRWLVDDLTDAEVAVMVSNSPHEWILGVYEGALRYRVERVPTYTIARAPARRAINSRGDRRGAIDELIVTNYPESKMYGRLESLTT